MRLADLHTHRLRPGTFGLLNLFSQDYACAGIPAGAEACSVGLHPWHVELCPWAVEQPALARAAADPQVWALGEAGLDKRCAAPWALQVEAFEAQARLAEAAGKPLVLHCVHAAGEVLAFRRRWGLRSPWIWHGAALALPEALRAAEAGCYLSFGKALLRPGKAAASLAALPPSAFLLESDDGAAPLEALYEAAAQLRGLSAEALAEQVWENAKNCFSSRYEELERAHGIAAGA
jgi:TatD DNase family protein